MFLKCKIKRILTSKTLVKARAFYFYNYCLAIAKCHPVPGTN
ncbi:hypothetical protein SynROS8604_03234 [Synechococcus sp. ROS8604]|nr:hypothetical protein SynROS8604_03234 [Synechococcus sp. ROS8604]